MCVGKSEFAFNLIKHRSVVYDVNFTRILYCLPEDNIHLHTDFINRLKATCDILEVVEGLPEVDKLQLKIDKRPKLVVIDDLVTKALASSVMLQLIMQDSHHSNIR